MARRSIASSLGAATIVVALTSACGSDDAAPKTSTTVAPTTSTPVTTTIASTTTKTIWTGPPTLAPDATLPTPISPPGPDEIDPTF